MASYLSSSKSCIKKLWDHIFAIKMRKESWLINSSKKLEQHWVKTRFAHLLKYVKHYQYWNLTWRNQIWQTCMSFSPKNWSFTNSTCRDTTSSVTITGVLKKSEALHSTDLRETTRAVCSGVREVLANHKYLLTWVLGLTRATGLMSQYQIMRT